MKAIAMVLVSGVVVVGAFLFLVLARTYVGLDPLLIFPLLMVLFALLLFRVVFPAALYRVPSAELARDELAVRHSGPPLATIVCGGRIGRMQFRGPLLRATVHPGGLVIRPLFLAPFALAAADITGVRYRRDWWAWGLEITHASRQVVSPIRLGCAERSDVVAALRSIAPVAAERPVW